MKIRIPAAAAALTLAAALAACSNNEPGDTPEAPPADGMTPPPVNPALPPIPADPTAPPPVNDPAAMAPDATSPATGAPTP